MVMLTRTLYTLSSWWEPLVHYSIGQHSVCIFLLVRISYLSSNWSGWTWWRVRSCSRVWPSSPPASATPLGPTSSDLSATGWAGQLPPPSTHQLFRLRSICHIWSTVTSDCVCCWNLRNGVRRCSALFLLFCFYGIVNWCHCQQKLRIS